LTKAKRVCEGEGEGESERETEREREMERGSKSKSTRDRENSWVLQSVVSYVSGGKWDGPKWEELGKRWRERGQGQIYGACQLLFPHGTIRKLFQC